MFLNEFDLTSIVDETMHRSDDLPNLVEAAGIVDRLAAWTNNNSDGWAYWAKPGRAATRLTDHLYREFLGRYDARTGEDISDDELRRGTATIKSFLTLHGVATADKARILGTD